MSRLRYRALAGLAGVAVVVGMVPPASAVSGGAVVPAGESPYLVRLEMPNRACSGSLVGPQWVITAATCFPDTPTGGTPKTAVKVAVGGRSVEVAGLVRREDRDVMLVELVSPVADVTPVAVGRTGVSTGASVRAGGFGRTATEWVPERASLAPFAVAGVNGKAVSMTGAGGKDLCKGDAGGPVLRDAAGGTELVAVGATSWQYGCLGETGTRQGSTATRVDDIAEWIGRVADPARPRLGPVKIGDLCLEAVDDGTLRVAGCVTGVARQEFTAAADGTLRVLGNCVDAGGMLTGVARPTRLWSCEGTDQQRWPIRENRSVVSPWNRMCLDATTFTAGAAVTTHPCHGGANQAWQWPVRPAWFGKLVGGDAQCLESADGSAVSAAACLASGYLPGAGRQDVTATSDGTIRVQGKCLHADGSAVGLRTCDGSDNQQWRNRDDRSLFSVSTSQCLDAARGGNARLSDCQAGPSRQWTVQAHVLPAAGSDRLVRGERLTAGQSKTSPDGRFTLIMQTDGNLVLYDAARQPLWNSGTYLTGATYAILQQDGNLVVYTEAGEPRWNTVTYGTAAERLVVQSDSNLVLYGPDAHPFWSRW